jgi:hypothetical protein
MCMVVFDVSEAPAAPGMVEEVLLIDVGGEALLLACLRQP